jgi:prepilin-type N-terminal cleavage/methylation domain-containing protein
VLTHARDQSGFTLVEMLVTLTVLTVVVAAFSTVFQTTVTRSATLTEHAALESEGRAVVDQIVSELRQAMCNDQTAPVVAASGTSVTFYTPDRATPYHLREVSYSLSGGTLSEQQATSTNTNGPPWTMPALSAAVDKVDSISNTPIFDFQDSSGADLSPGGAAVSAANLPNISYAEITLVLQPTASHNVDQVFVQSSVDLRETSCS